MKKHLSFLLIVILAICLWNINSFFSIQSPSHLTSNNKSSVDRKTASIEPKKNKSLSPTQLNNKNTNREPSSIKNSNSQNDDYFYEPDMENPYLQAVLKKYNATSEVYYNHTNYFLSDYKAIKTNAFNLQLGDKIEDKYGYTIFKPNQTNNLDLDEKNILALAVNPLTLQPEIVSGIIKIQISNPTEIDDLKKMAAATNGFELKELMPYVNIQVIKVHNPIEAFDTAINLAELPFKLIEVETISGTPVMR